MVGICQLFEVWDCSSTALDRAEGTPDQPCFLHIRILHKFYICLGWKPRARSPFLKKIKIPLFFSQTLLLETEIQRSRTVTGNSSMALCHSSNKDKHNKQTIFFFWTLDLDAINIKWTRYGPLTQTYTTHRQEKVCMHIYCSEQRKNFIKGAWMPFIQIEPYHSCGQIDDMSIKETKCYIQLQLHHLVDHLWYM